MSDVPIFELEFNHAIAAGMISLFRQNAGLSVRKCAADAGMSGTHFAWIEKGGDFSITKLLQLCSATGIPPNAILKSGIAVRVKVDAALAQIKDSIFYQGMKPPMDAKSFLEDLKNALHFTVTLLLSSNPIEDAQGFAAAIPEFARELISFGDWCEEASVEDRAAIFRRLRYEPVRFLANLGFFKEYTQDALSSDAGENLIDARNLPVSQEVVIDSEQHLERLIEELKPRLLQRGKKAELARFLGVTDSAVAHYLSGASAPSAEVALRMLAWVKASEKTKSPARVSAQARPVTQPTNTKTNDKRKPSRKRP